jgi:putative phosphoribosyl transferase
MWFRDRRHAGRVLATKLRELPGRANLVVLADLSICALTPEPFHAVGLSYRDFSQTTDDEVRQLLGGAQESGLRAQQGLS